VKASIVPQFLIKDKGVLVYYLIIALCKGKEIMGRQQSGNTPSIPSELDKRISMERNRIKAGMVLLLYLNVMELK